MARILVTGSAAGLGRLSAESLVATGHDLIVHARNEERATSLQPLVNAGARLVIANLTVREDVLRLAAQLNDADPIDAVVHNAGVWNGPAVMPVNVVAPYVLSALMPSPGRLVYLSSGSHYGGRPDTSDVDWSGKRPGSYEDSKLFVTTLMAAVSRLRPHVLSNAVDPGWVPTRMGGAGAPDDLDLGHQTQEWLASSNDPSALTSGGYWYHRRQQEPHAAVHDEGFQNRLLTTLAQETGVTL